MNNYGSLKNGDVNIKGKKIIVNCDNLVSVHVINSGATKTVSYKLV